MSFSALLKTVPVSIDTRAPERCESDANSHDLSCGLRHRALAAHHFRIAQPSHSDDSSNASEPINLDTASVPHYP